MIVYSIIICTYNRVQYLKETIASLLYVLKERDDYEIIIIDNNSSDGTNESIKEFTHIPGFRYVFEINQGLSHARNRGIAESTGNILVFLDDDIELDDNYFNVCDKLFLQNSAAIVGGKVLPYNAKIPDWLPGKYRYLASIFDLGDKPLSVLYVMGANYAMTKEAALKIGWYNVDLGRKGNSLMAGEETNYLDRARAIGYNVLYDPELMVYHKINNKLNKEYIYNYAYELGRSQKISDKHSLRTKVIYIVTVKSIAAQLLFHILGHFKLKPVTNSYLKITQAYGYGYIRSK